MKKSIKRGKKVSREMMMMNSMWKLTSAKLKEKLPEDVINTWFEDLKIIAAKRDKVVFLMPGYLDYEEFVLKYYDDLESTFIETLGYDINIEIRQEKVKEPKKETPGRKKVTLLITAACFICLIGVMIFIGKNLISNMSFKENFYQVGSGKIDGSVRIVHMSDLHNTEFGNNNIDLTSRIEKLDPDIIVMTGDMIEQHKSYDTVVSLCKTLVNTAPVYYIYGNDECTDVFDIPMSIESIDELLGQSSGKKDISKIKELPDELRKSLESAGVKVLFNESDTIEMGNNVVDIYGVLTSNTSAFWPYAEESYGEFMKENDDHFKLLLTHEPYIFEEYAEENEEAWGDLVLCGHTHGGIVRLPYFGGLYERKNGLFPETDQTEKVYIKGPYTVGGKPLIVNSGLTNKGMIRISNEPELIIVDVNRY